MFLFPVLMVIKRAYRERKKKTTYIESSVLMLYVLARWTVISFIPGNRIAACLRITTAHAFPIASLVKINGEAAALGKYTPVFSLVRATAISPSPYYRRPAALILLGRGMKWSRGTPGFRAGFDENVRLTPSDLPIQSAPHCLKVLAAISRAFRYHHYQYHHRVHVRQTANMSSHRPNRVDFQPLPVASVRFQRWCSLDSRRTRQSVWSRDCSFNVSYIDRAAALITIRGDCSNSASSSRVSPGRRNIRWEIAAAEETVQDRAGLAGWLTRWVRRANLLRSLRSLTLAFFRSWIPGHLYRWLIPWWRWVRASHVRSSAFRSGWQWLNVYVECAPLPLSLFHLLSRLDTFIDREDGSLPRTLFS